ncbi:sigma-70 family RNA polymerase sigma factor [Conexibacter arvalis]|uniref:RNA polymerase sigma-70 factor (ECF subfamily) n=1 Tax=Conexibacter arvalis TaxID=912552 RepID=A0A840II86_9ACTN|nr:RNA polymerase sigma-70 factor (ECF subfamily) [Conexibacter arvalis]
MTAPADRARLEALYAQHAAAVHAYARRRTDAAAAEDAVAETFLVAWRRLDRVPAGDPLPWLFATARHVLANQRRGDARRAALSARLHAEPAPPRPASGVSEEGARLLHALAALSATDREALLLTAWEGLEPARAAAALGCTRATFNVRLHRARKRLAKALAHESPSGGASSTAPRESAPGVASARPADRRRPETASQETRR